MRDMSEASGRSASPPAGRAPRRPLGRRALAGPLLAIALAPRAAGAFRLEPASPADAAAWAEGACREAALHEALLAEWRAMGEGAPAGPATDGAGRQPAVPLPRCPFCGCPVLGGADHGEGAAPRG
ncbi:hypothetical protein [Crenalkalicoccus roseus]|uniref:hypothetical protein n=1 Tax=Crenalkalicoccus roseus TaxID=1485588 RepID=UPI0010817225|nr:hypothetical protein [Crenalkalicoccus roseus]